MKLLRHLWQQEIEDKARETEERQSEIEGRQNKLERQLRLLLTVTYIWVIFTGLAALRSAYEANQARQSRLLVKRSDKDGPILTMAWSTELGEGLRFLVLLCLLLPGLFAIFVPFPPPEAIRYASRGLLIAAAVLLFLKTELHAHARRKVIAGSGL
jgi:hypothetical protein